MKLWNLIFPAVLIIGCSTGSEEPKTATPINPNGDSELALLMREMYEESDRIKQQVQAGKTPTGLKRFEAIHTAVPTDSDASGPVFESMATAYIESVKALEKADSSSVFRFNALVDQCMNCHSQFCPGPKVRIKKLYIRTD